MQPKKKNPAGAASPVLAMAAITALTQRERIATFADRAKVSQRAFIEMGKLMFAISADLKKNETIYSVMRKAGIKDGTTSNASYASRVWEMVTEGHITEARYDTFTFQDVLSICRVLGPKSKQRLSREEVAIVVGDKNDFQPDLHSLFEYGLTVDEKAAQDKAAAEPSSAAAPVSAGKSPDAPAAHENPQAPSAPGTESPAPPAGPSAPDKQPAKHPENLTPLPPAKPSADDAIRLLEAVETMMLDLPEEEQKRVARRVLDLAETINSFIDSSPVAKPLPAKTGTKLAKAA